MKRNGEAAQLLRCAGMAGVRCRVSGVDRRGDRAVMKIGPGRYILRGHEPVMVEDVETWARWFGTANRVVRRTTIEKFSIHISTVFLGLDHNWSSEGPPLLFETMIFETGNACGLDERQWRYSTWDESEAGHVKAVCTVLALLCAPPEPKA
jgi:hypothetical protein